MGFFPGALPASPSETHPGPLSPGPGAVNYQMRGKPMPPFIYVRCDDTPRAADGNPKPHAEAIGKGLELARAYIRRNPHIDKDEGVGIVIAHKISEMVARR